MKWLQPFSDLLLDRPDATASYLERASPPSRVDDSNVTSAIFSDDVSALKKLKRGKAEGPDEIRNSFYHNYAYALAPILAAPYSIWMEYSVFPTSNVDANIQCL